MVFRVPSAEKTLEKIAKKTFSYLDEVETCKNKKDELFYLGPSPFPPFTTSYHSIRTASLASLCVEGRGIALLS
jgi:hypothetical protein